MADFETIRDAKNDLVRVHMEFAILFDNMDNASVSTLEDTVTGDLDIPATAESAGIIEKQAGVSLTHNIESSDIEGYGDSEPVRTVISKRVIEFQANFLETNKVVLEKFWGIEFDDDNLDVSTGGGVTIKAPDRPGNIHYRAYLVATDDVNGDELYAYYIMPRVKLVNVDTQQSQDDGAVSYSITFRATKDKTMGFSVLQGWCGPGWLRLVAKAGFVAPVTSITAAASSASIVVGDTEQITVTGSNTLNYTPITKYTVSAGAAVKVDQSGLVTALAAGSATVTAAFDGQTDDVDFTVTTS
ncbi:Ig-like domain-containing protein [Mycolicibacterium palauense]|uniref:Ig-like domain-containing protein n=1 Tax=Mycolicibacterium palauense TaxID=2034511 RepID=UPI000BFEE7C2|nr:Ig-like domain-containing protein [Mycolicibacterium palauense]